MSFCPSAEDVIPLGSDLNSAEINVSHIYAEVDSSSSLGWAVVHGAPRFKHYLDIVIAMKKNKKVLQHV